MNILQIPVNGYLPKNPSINVINRHFQVSSKYHYTFESFSLTICQTIVFVCLILGTINHFNNKNFVTQITRNGIVCLIFTL